MSMSPPSSPRGPAAVLVGLGLLSLASVPFWANPAEAGLLPSASEFTKTACCCMSGEHKITVWSYAPKTQGKHPALVMLYGLDCLCESPARYEFLAQRFVSKGYVVHFVHYFDCTRVAKK